MTPREMLEELEHSAERLENNGLRGMRVEIDWIRAIAKWVRELEAERDAAQSQCADHQRGENAALNRAEKAEARVETLKSVLRRALLSDACRWVVIPKWHVDGT